MAKLKFNYKNKKNSDSVLLSFFYENFLFAYIIKTQIHDVDKEKFSLKKKKKERKITEITVLREKAPNLK